MGQLDTIVGWTKKLESALETRLGAEGRGLHEKTGSVEHRLDKDLIRLLRKIATMRNKAMHEDGYVVEDIDRFVKDCEHAHNRIVHLETSKPRSRAPLNTLRVNEPPAWMKASKEAIKRDILKVFSNRRGSEAVLGACQVESGGGGFWKLALREAVELTAPVFWLTSFGKLVDLIKQPLVFGFSLFGFYQVFHWLLTGVPSSWWLVLQIPAALFGVMVAMTWLGKSA